MLTKIGDWVLAAGRPAVARMRRWRRMARSVIARSKSFFSLSDDAIQEKSRQLRWQAKTGTALDELLIDSYALVREASRRTSGKEHYPVQILAGIALFEGRIVEMQTGEGKTLTATLPAYLRALPGRGCHVITANDYLALRDAKTNFKLFERLGLSCACVISELEDPERKEAYAQDITYGTVREFGFDFLRDRLRAGASSDFDTQPDDRLYHPSTSAKSVQRGHDFALVDEADSVLIDEARTPLVIGLPRPVDPVTLSRVRWSQRIAAGLLMNDHFEFDPNRRQAVLRTDGCRKVLLAARPSLIAGVSSERLYRSVELALVARHGFHAGRDYLVVEGKVVIVDESTGRTMEGRKWQEELHQAIEAKEHLPITTTTGSAARITVQSFFRRYEHLAGMTGTAMPARRELKKTYGREVAIIPTHRPCIRQALPIRIFASREARWNAVAEEIARLNAEGRAVLAGTPSVTASQALSNILKARGIPHQVLNALFHEQEADIVQHAGEPGQVTIATNMAGRGTDILLSEQVRASGGLHVLATEMHSSARIDRQLVGRSARQGDPGSFQFLLSVEDELFRAIKPDQYERWKKQAAADADERGELRRGWFPKFLATQRLLEKSHAVQRGRLLQVEQQQTETCRRLGLDPWLELVE